MCALVAAILAGGGCRSTSSGVNNPFMAPDRVSPPSTRVIAPGQAQPYYQGDPLPVMQSGATPPANELVAANSSAEALSSSGKTLAWTNPGGTAPTAPSTPVATDAAVPWGVNPPPLTPTSYGSEPAVAVPVDTSSLRFALPAPINPDPATPIAAAAPPVPQPVQPVGITPNQPVMLASYNAPNAPVASAPMLSPMPPVPTPWRTPVSPTAPAPAYGPQPLLQPNVIAQTPDAMYANPVPVQLRSVPSPPQPGDPNPRIRIPGYAGQQTGTADGFRPRTSMQ